MGIPIDSSPLNGAPLNGTNNEIYFTKYSYIDTYGIICQNIHIDYTSSSTGDFKIIITRYRQDPVFHFDISNFDATFSADEDLFNDSSIMDIFFVQKIL